MEVLTEIIKYIRIRLLSEKVRELENVVIILDVLVANCDYRVHILMNQKVFMTTLSKVCRRQLSLEGQQHIRLATYMLDIIQVEKSMDMYMWKSMGRICCVLSCIVPSWIMCTHHIAISYSYTHLHMYT
jgi:hypothetical protein